MKCNTRFVLINVLLVFAVGLILWGVTALYNPKLFPIRSIQTLGHYRHVARTDIVHLVRPLIQKSFFDVDIMQIRRQLLTLSWISTVNVARVWPDKLVLSLEERVPVAIWNRQHLITDDGIVFANDITEFENRLPELIGPRDQQTPMLAHYRKFARMLLPLNLQIAQLELSAGGVWSMQFQGGLKLMLGQDDMDASLKRFTKIYPKMLANAHHSPKYIDTRYPNGVAVRWR